MESSASSTPYRGKITVFRHPGGHHPHDLPGLSPLIDWILRHGIGMD